MAEKSKQAISDEVALKEVIDFVQKWKRRPQKEDLIKEDYPDVIEAVKSGNLVFDENQRPIYTLRSPIKTSEGNVHLDKVEFRIRVKPTTQADLADGLKLQTQQAKYVLRVISYIIDQPLTMLDKFEGDDYDTIQQICTVFM